MRAWCVCVVLPLLASAALAEPTDERVKNRFDSPNYAVTWGKVAAYDASAELEIGDGYGHGGTLGWLRFQPVADGVHVLSITLSEGRDPVWSKWPPDRVAVEVKRARMEREAYAGLLRDLALVDSARLTQLASVRSGRWTSSSFDFWVYCRVTGNRKVLQDLDWSGYASSLDEARYAKPAVAVAIAREMTKTLEFAEHVLSDEERRWASAKFSRDMKKFREIENVKDMELSYWWVRERYTMAIGVIGDPSSLPALREILQRAPAERHKYDSDAIDMSRSQDRKVYYAINAITRLTKKDVRPRPVEELDVEATRRKVLELLPD